MPAEATATAVETPTPATPTPRPTATATPKPAPPAATAEPIATVTATPPAEPTAPAAATPTPRSGLALIDPAPDAFVHRTFGDGETIDWLHGIFVLDAETGRTDGYAEAGLEGGERYYRRHRGDRIETSDEEWGLLLDRETGQSWRWPRPVRQAVETSEGWQTFEQRTALRLMATSEAHLLFEEVGPAPVTDRYILADRRMEEVFRFSIDGNTRSAMFSPDGRTIAIGTGERVYLFTIESARVALLFEAPPDRDLWFGPRDDGAGISAIVPESGKDGYILEERRDFSWSGAALPAPPAPSCPGTLSPDGRYAAVPKGAPYYVHYVGYAALENPWPSVVITDAETCAPIFRVRSAYTDNVFWHGDKWLSTSGGFVVGVRGGYAIARVRPAPELIALPYEWPGPEAAPTGEGRYFGYGAQVYDAAEDRWRGPADVEFGPYWWGDSHRERWFSIGYWGEGWVSWLLLPPKIEFPPFGDEVAFRVARTGSCLRLREEPVETGRVLGCLPDGERLLLAERDDPDPRPPPSPAKAGSYDPRPPHPSLAGSGPHLSLGMDSHLFSLVGAVDPWWVYVRTGDGAEGWVNHGYLDHD